MLYDDARIGIVEVVKFELGMGKFLIARGDSVAAKHVCLYPVSMPRKS